jgi:hypothetical protein
MLNIMFQQVFESQQSNLHMYVTNSRNLSSLGQIADGDLAKFLEQSHS